METTRKPRAGNIKRRWLVALAAAAVTIGTVGIASPAQADINTEVAFQIFYGQNCGNGGGASRSYFGANSGEYWVNDIFTNNQFGSAGFGQAIRNNAASVFVRDGSVTIYINETTGTGFWGSHTGQCHNFPSWMRNQNVKWTSYTAH